MRPLRTISRLFLTNLLGATKAYKHIDNCKQYEFFELLKSEILFTFYNISGSYLINEDPDCASILGIDYDVTFNSNNIPFTCGLHIDTETQTLYYSSHAILKDLDAETLTILGDNVIDLGPSGYKVPVYNQGTGWIDEAFRTIIIDNPQEVSSSLYMWLSVNTQNT